MAHNSLDHLKSPRWQWFLFLGLAVLTLVCGTIGLQHYEHDHLPPANHGMSPLHHATQFLMLHAPHFDHGVNPWLELGRWFGAATIAVGTIGLLWRRLCREFRLFRLGWWSGHHVICGLGVKGFEIVHCLLKREPRPQVVVLDPQPDPHFVEHCDRAGVCVLAHDAAEPKALALARVSHAREVVVITPRRDQRPDRQRRE